VCLKWVVTGLTSSVNGSSTTALVSVSAAQLRSRQRAFKRWTSPKARFGPTPPLSGVNTYLIGGLTVGSCKAYYATPRVDIPDEWLVTSGRSAATATGLGWRAEGSVWSACVKIVKQGCHKVR
jgi:hypothetical protein